MENKLKIGQSFEIVEWMGFNDYREKDIGFQSLVEENLIHGFFMFAPGHYDYILADYSQIKPIGKLTITKLK